MKPPVDWERIRVDYINGTMNYQELAETHGVKAGTVRQRGHRGGWDQQRHVVTQAVIEEASRRKFDTRLSELSEFNDGSLKIAKALMQQVAAHISNAQQTQKRVAAPELRALASVAEAAQRMGRLALGVSTDNHQHTGSNGGPIGVSSVPLPLYQEALKHALEEY